MRVRVERFGGLVDDGERIVAVNRAAMRALGVADSPLWAAPADDATLSAPLVAHVLLSRRCPGGCWYCSVDATADGEEMSLETGLAVLDDLARRGVFTVAFGGGEPLLHPHVLTLARHAKARGLNVTMTTSGVGLPAAVDALAVFDAIHVSLAPCGVPALERLAPVHPRVGVNVLVTRDTDYAAVAALARRLKLHAVRLLRLRPEGRALGIVDDAAPDMRLLAGLRVIVDSPRPGAMCTVDPAGMWISGSDPGR